MLSYDCDLKLLSWYSQSKKSNIFLIEIEEKNRSAKSATLCKCGTIPSVAMFECLSKAKWLNCGDMPDCKFIVEQRSEKNTIISFLETMFTFKRQYLRIQGTP